MDSELNSSTPPLLGPGEPPVFEVVNLDGASDVVLVCDHASNRIPQCLGTLGLDDIHLTDHIAWDPGAAVVARKLSTLLDAPLILSGYSRLVIDCNRPLSGADSIPERSANVPVPGNCDLALEDRDTRINALFRPYHDAITRLLDSRTNRTTLLFSIHSFTPVLFGQTRPWHIGISNGRDRRLAALLLGALACTKDCVVGDNKPYPVGDGFDYTIPAHGDSRGLPSVMIEIRQDGIRTAQDAAMWAERIAQAYRMVEVNTRRYFAPSAAK